MRIIKKADEEISKLWLDGKTQSTVYRLFLYVIKAETDDGLLLLNTVTGELISLDTEERNNLSYLPCNYMPWMDELIKKHFLVKEEYSDKTTIDTLRIAMKTLNSKKEITSYTILPSTHCNARCFYCYECGIKHENMTDETVLKTVDYIKAHSNNKHVMIQWFGGEPLLGAKQIDKICNMLKESNVDYSSSMISNGYLLDSNMVSRAKKEWHLNKIQITIDGTEEVYNQTKNYINPCISPYKKVLDNIKKLQENEIDVSIRLNLGMHNHEDLEALVSDLDNYFKDKSHLSVYTHLLFDDCGTKPTHFNKEELEFLTTKLEKIEKRIQECSTSAGLYDLPQLKASRCMADSPSSIVILPSGKLTKCEHCVNSHFVGDLDNGITDKNELKKFNEIITCQECTNCPLYSACIKLKICEPDRECNKEMVNSLIKRVQVSMLNHYRVFNNGDIDSIQKVMNP